MNGLWHGSAYTEYYEHMERQSMEMKAVKALNEYFNKGENKKGIKAFADEIKELNDEEKRELASLACAAMGATLID